ncbi:ArnT family glycosyltransferase [Sinomonas sp. P47F7]|uniref:ArnT family glycosyltransferase n=1 Tax=Sinomonas sp. P47F7 TaxID=3410987 RepID=UPI003BF4AF4E
MVGVLSLSAGLNFWNLSANGWANAFYTAAVQSGLHSGEAFLFGSSDWGNAISVDKPPLSLWLMGVSVRIFGFNSWGILVPQALLGVATTALVYSVVRRRAGAAAALTAALIFATTPIVVLLSRYNNPDPFLTFLVMLGLAAALRGIESPRVRWFLVAGAFLGLGFLAKQFQVLLIAPALASAALSMSRSTWRKALLNCGAAILAFAAVAGSWLTFVDLTPASARPFVGGSTTNSLTELTLGYNGVNRITSADDYVTGLIPQQFGGGGSDAGPLRLFNANYNQEASWILLLGLACGIMSAWCLRRTRAGALALVSAVWLITVYLLLSFMGHDIHTYYTMSLAPPLALTVGLGIEALSLAPRSRGRRAIVALGVGLCAVASWLTLGSLVPIGPMQILSEAALACGLGGAVLTAIPPPLGWINKAAACLVVIGLSLGPLATDFATLNRGQTGSSPASGSLTASPSSMSRFLASLRNNDPKWASDLALGASPPGPLAEKLADSNSSCRWTAATFPAQTAANWQLVMNRPVMPLGGFSASDPSPTLDQFAEAVGRGSICYLIDYPEMDPIISKQPTISSIVAWVRSTFPHETIDGVTIYHLSG